MAHTPFFSVIITTYNRSSYLADTLDAVLKQSFENIEIIVIDDGSTDDTEYRVKQINDERLSYKKIDNWGGPARPRNVGIGAAKGSYLAFCDDDDVWEHEKLETLHDVIQQQGANMLFSNVSYIDQHSKEICCALKLKVPDVLPIRSDLLVLNNFITLSSCVVSRKLLGESRFIEDKRFIAAEDRILWHELNTRSQIHYCPHPLVKYRKHIGGISFSRDVRHRLNCLTLDKLENEFGYNKDILHLSKLIVDLKSQLGTSQYMDILLTGLKMLYFSLKYRKLRAMSTTVKNVSPF